MSEGRILVVEDNERNLKLVRDVLRLLANECAPDLVLMDLQLPNMDGTEALRLLRAGPLTREVPVVAVTALAMKDDRDRTLRAGFDGYLEKPISVRALPEQVRGFLAGKEPPDGR